MIAYVNDTISHNAENIFTCFMKSTRTFPPLTSVYAKRFTACFIARWSMSMWWKLFYEWNNKIDRRESFPLSCKPAAFSAHSEKKWRKNIEKRSDDEIFCHKSHSHVETCMWESVKKAEKSRILEENWKLKSNSISLLAVDFHPIPSSPKNVFATLTNFFSERRKIQNSNFQQSRHHLCCYLHGVDPDPETARWSRYCDYGMECEEWGDDSSKQNQNQIDFQFHPPQFA